MAFPYQCIEIFESPLLQKSIVLAASGPVLYAFDLKKVQIVAQWRSSETKEDDHDSASSTEIITSTSDSEHRVKRRKRAEARNDQPPSASDISMIRVSGNGKYIALVTGTDKSIHVLELTKYGTFEHLSVRQMAKRPCAMCFDSQSAEILCADKFGDVYALPVIFEDGSHDEPPDGRNKAQDVDRPFKPVATPLTVHSGRNLRALEAQEKQAPQITKQRDVMMFEHRLLLGHVSMLTDIMVLSTQTPMTELSETNGHAKSRDYIVTADRDEHIRISRAAPQAHVIERYCFGHQQFVNCLAEVIPGVLVSGGGDPFLCLWDWRSGELLCRLDVLDYVQFVRRRLKEEQGADRYEKIDTSVAVSKLLCPISNVNGKDTCQVIHFICEGVPAIFTYRIEHQSAPFHERYFYMRVTPLRGNPLDIARSGSSLLVSIDCVHDKGSTDTVRQTLQQEMNDLQVLRVMEGRIFEDNILQRNMMQLQQQASRFTASGAGWSTEEASSRIQDLCYGVEKLRKQDAEAREDFHVRRDPGFTALSPSGRIF